MNPRIGARLTRMAKVLATLCAIELCLPGGTLLALGYLLALQCHVHRSAAGKPALPTWRDLLGLLAGHPVGGLAPGTNALQTADGVKEADLTSADTPKANISGNGDDPCK